MDLRFPISAVASFGGPIALAQNKDTFIFI